MNSQRKGQKNLGQPVLEYKNINPEKLEGQYAKQRAVLDEVLVKVKILRDHMSSRSSRLQEDERTMETDVQTLAEQKEKIETSKKLGLEMEEKIKLIEVQDLEISERISKARFSK